MERYRFHADGSVYFVTFSIVDWLPVFVTEKAFQIVSDSLNFCHHKKGLRINAYVIMPTHFHAIFFHHSFRADELEKVVTDFRKFTGQHFAASVMPAMPEFAGRFRAPRGACKCKVQAVARVSGWPVSVRPNLTTGPAGLVGRKVRTPCRAFLRMTLRPANVARRRPPNHAAPCLFRISPEPLKLRLAEPLCANLVFSGFPFIERSLPMTVALPKLRVGDPLRHEALSVFPLFAEPNGSVDFRLSDDALADESLLVEEVSECGSVPDLLVENKGDDRVLFLEGEELVGAKQNRILKRSGKAKNIGPSRSEETMLRHFCSKTRWFMAVSSRRCNSTPLAYGTTQQLTFISRL